MMSRINGAARMVAAGCITVWTLTACHEIETPAAATPSTGFSGQDASAPTLTNNVAVDGRNWINYRRMQVGMPALTRNANIDTAAQSHSDYQRINNVVTHEQTSGKEGFTGVRLQDRLAAANYVVNADSPNAIGEVISASNNDSGFYMAEELITAIYHRFVIFEPVFKEIGSGAAATSAGYHYFTADFAANNGYGPGLATGVLATWPFGGQTGVPVNFFSDYEEPDPVPDVNEVGYPVSVHTNLNRVLTVQRFTIRPHDGGSILPARLLSEETDTNTSTASAAAIVPLAPLAAGTTYDVAFSGAIDGTAISRSWSFTTK
jgi:uncharacterized protein YkwD